MKVTLWTHLSKILATTPDGNMRAWRHEVLSGVFTGYDGFSDEGVGIDRPTRHLWSGTRDYNAPLMVVAPAPSTTEADQVAIWSNMAGTATILLDTPDYSADLDYISLRVPTIMFKGVGTQFWFVNNLDTLYEIADWDTRPATITSRRTGMAQQNPYTATSGDNWAYNSGSGQLYYLKATGISRITLAPAYTISDRLTLLTSPKGLSYDSTNSVCYCNESGVLKKWDIAANTLTEVVAEDLIPIGFGGGQVYCLDNTADGQILIYASGDDFVTRSLVYSRTIGMYAAATRPTCCYLSYSSTTRMSLSYVVRLATGDYEWTVAHFTPQSRGIRGVTVSSALGAPHTADVQISASLVPISSVGGLTTILDNNDDAIFQGWVTHRDGGSLTLMGADREWYETVAGTASWTPGTSTVNQILTALADEGETISKGTIAAQASVYNLPPAGATRAQIGATLAIATDGIVYSKMGVDDMEIHYSTRASPVDSGESYVEGTDVFRVVRRLEETRPHFTGITVLGGADDGGQIVSVAGTAPRVTLSIPLATDQDLCDDLCDELYADLAAGLAQGTTGEIRCFGVDWVPAGETVSVTHKDGFGGDYLVTGSHYEVRSRILNLQVTSTANSYTPLLNLITTKGTGTWTAGSETATAGGTPVTQTPISLLQAGQFNGDVTVAGDLTAPNVQALTLDGPANAAWVTMSWNRTNYTTTVYAPSNMTGFTNSTTQNRYDQFILSGIPLVLADGRVLWCTGHRVTTRTASGTNYITAVDLYSIALTGGIGALRSDGTNMTTNSTNNDETFAAIQLGDSSRAHIVMRVQTVNPTAYNLQYWNPQLLVYYDDPP